MPSPWLHIPINDYEGHMAHAAVAQAQMLGALLRRAVSEYRPRSLAILGAAGGNGLEVVDLATVQRVVALDLNPHFLALCTERHAQRFARYEAVLHDLEQGPPALEPVELIYAGLLLEYLDYHAFFAYLPDLLSPEGVFVALLQLPSSQLPTVSGSPFPSLRQLESVFHYVDPGTVRTTLLARGFTCCAEKVIRLESGKEFHQAEFRLNKSGSKKPAAALTRM
jgi:hypothetical protein